ncbi:hypothetical protein [Vibrio rotiferianus]|uniref:hypothetical protein n=1 Tax=Vibrio rotiferianus TaxID=190895 RepID=UPI0011107FDE|nr:hypothetical protein [Vibrio rotiferianus]
MKKTTLILLIVFSAVSGPVNALSQFLDLSRNDFTHAYINHFSYFYITPEVPTQEEESFRCLSQSALRNNWHFSYWPYGEFSLLQPTLFFFFSAELSFCYNTIIYLINK